MQIFPVAYRRAILPESVGIRQNLPVGKDPDRVPNQRVRPADSARSVQCIMLTGSAVSWSDIEDSVDRTDCRSWRIIAFSGKSAAASLDVTVVGPGMRRLAAGWHVQLRASSDASAVQSNPRSSAGAECVRPPTLIRSTPVRAISPVVARETPPDASSSVCGAS